MRGKANKVAAGVDGPDIEQTAQVIIAPVLLAGRHVWGWGMWFGLAQTPSCVFFGGLRGRKVDRLMGDRRKFRTFCFIFETVFCFCPENFGVVLRSLNTCLNQSQQKNDENNWVTQE